MSAVRDFEPIFLGGTTYQAKGKFKLSEAGIGWKNHATQQIVTVSSSDIHQLIWLRVARDYQLKIVKQDSSTLRFDGFPKDAFEGLSSLVKSYYRVNLQEEQVSLRGYNWGHVEFNGADVQFNVASKHAFDFPLSQVSNATIGAKHEVAVEFAPPPPSDPNVPQRGGQDHLVEIRFYVPGSVTQGQITELDDGKITFRDKSEIDAVSVDQTNEEGEISLAAQKVVNGPDGEPIAASTVFFDTLKSRTDLGRSASEAIVDFEELLCLTPRGRYQVGMHSNFLRLRGKTHDYQILYSSIKRLFLVPRPDELHWLFVIGLDPPLRQGQTRYPHLVFQFEKEDEMELELNITETLLEEKYKNVLVKNYDGPVHQVVTDIFHGLTGKRVVNASENFMSATGQKGVKCSQKANEAILYPLEKAFLSMPKPTIYMAFTDIAAITFSRATSANSSTKMFEMKFNLRSGTEYSFSSIPREEHAALEAFCRMKNLPIRSEIADEGPRAYIGSSDDEGGRMKRTKPDYQDDMESESEDEDFKGAVGSDESDVAEEFNEDYSSSSGEEQEGGENASNQGAPASPAQASPKIAKHVSILPKSKPAKKPQEASSSQPKKQKDSASFEKPAKKRAKKDPNAPKRALSAFILFSQAMRASILAETPGASIGDVAKALGVKWKAISAEDRAPFDALAIEEKERYAAQMAAYKSEDKPSASVSAPAKKASPSKTEHKSAEMVESDSE